MSLTTPRNTDSFAMFIAFVIALVNAIQFSANVVYIQVRRLGHRLYYIRIIMAKGGMGFMEELIIGAVGITVVILFVASLIQPIVSTTNSLTTGATPVVAGGGAALLNQTSLFLAVALIMIVIGLAILAIRRGLHPR